MFYYSNNILYCRIPKVDSKYLSIILYEFGLVLENINRTSIHIKIFRNCNNKLIQNTKKQIR